MATEMKKKPAAAAPKAEKAPRVAKPVVAKIAAPIVHPIHRRKALTGKVISNKMQKTIVVQIERQVRHHLYGKFISHAKKFKAHDEKNEAKIGDVVTVVASRPLSKDKRWALQKIVRRAIQTADANV